MQKRFAQQKVRQIQILNGSAGLDELGDKVNNLYINHLVGLDDV